MVYTKAKAKFTSATILCDIDQQIFCNQRPIKVTKSNYKELKIKKSRIEELNAKF